ncbi:MAG: tetraacyldisaccharide 4'-kinase [Flavobacteriales bacterium AspAUS03]
METTPSKRTLLKNSLLRCLIGQPLSWGYRTVTKLRNHLYDKDWIPSTSFPLPILCIGNLSLGGTGKTPHTEYLIHLLKEKYKTAVLSRGYKRKSQGFICADKTSTTADIGDEPLQYFKKFDEEISIAVDEDRVHGIRALIQLVAPEVILLDDGFQHRCFRDNYNILLTEHDQLYCDDALLPLGTLREDKSNAKRADIIIVTKCSEQLDEKHQKEIIKKLRPEKTQHVFFSSIKYADTLQAKEKKFPLKELEKMHILLVTGIAHAQPILDFLKSKVSKVIHLNYSDHHTFTTRNYLKIRNLFEKIPTSKIIVTTEKDYMRMDLSQFKDLPVFYLPISIQIYKRKKFNEKILYYVNTTQANHRISPK